MNILYQSAKLVIHLFHTVSIYQFDKLRANKTLYNIQI